MNIIIVGDGKVGLTLTEQLSKEEHDIVIIDKNPTVLQNSQETFDVMVVPGNGASRQVLLEAGAENADLVVACFVVSPQKSSAAPIPSRGYETRSTLNSWFF